MFFFQSPTQQEAIAALKKRLEETTIPEFPRHRLRMLSKLSEGSFGTVWCRFASQNTKIHCLFLQVYIAEADRIMEYSSSLSLGSRLVAIKFLGESASEKEKYVVKTKET